MKTAQQHINTTIVLPDGSSYRVEALVKWTYDPAYGADADGNRGMGVWDLDEIEYLSVVNGETDKKVDFDTLDEHIQELFDERVLVEAEREE